MAVRLVVLAGEHLSFGLVSSGVISDGFDVEAVLSAARAAASSAYGVVFVIVGLLVGAGGGSVFC